VSSGGWFSIRAWFSIFWPVFQLAIWNRNFSTWHPPIYISIAEWHVLHRHDFCFFYLTFSHPLRSNVLACSIKVTLLGKLLGPGFPNFWLRLRNYRYFHFFDQIFNFLGVRKSMFRGRISIENQSIRGRVPIENRGQKINVWATHSKHSFGGQIFNYFNESFDIRVCIDWLIDCMYRFHDESCIQTIKLYHRTINRCVVHGNYEILAVSSIRINAIN